MASTTTHTTNGENMKAQPKSILAISLAKYLHDVDIAVGIAKDWDLKATPQQQSRFDNQGFNLDPTDEEGTLANLRTRLQGQNWDGVIVGWCTRGNRQFTLLFEKVVSELVREVVRKEKSGLVEGGAGLKLMFCDGPDDLVNTTLRTFGAE